MRRVLIDGRVLFDCKPGEGKWPFYQNTGLYVDGRGDARRYGPQPELVIRKQDLIVLEDQP